MGRADVTQDVVLQRITSILRNALGLNESTCYETLEPPGYTAIPAASFWITIRPGHGHFHENEQSPVQCIETWNVQVTLYAKVALDRAGHDRETLLEAARGLYPNKLKVLKALVGIDPTTDGTTDGDTFVRQLVYCTGCSMPQVASIENTPNRGIGYMTLDFDFSWDWDLRS